MKLCNLKIQDETHLGLVTERGVIDASGTGLRMEDVIAGADRAPLEALEADPAAPAVEKPVFANILERADKIVCVGLNYREHARRAGLPISESMVFLRRAGPGRRGDRAAGMGGQLRL